jgi:polyhydroxyalkanoate synthase
MTPILLTFAMMDNLRRAQGRALAVFGFGPGECGYRILAAGPHWRLRDYGGTGAGPPLLIVSAPIKRPYIWDLAPAASAVRTCLRHGLRVHLLEWTDPARGDDGLEAYADTAIAEAAARVAEAAGRNPFLMGHSLGGTLAAIFAALDAHSLSGLVLLGAPLCFQPGVSRFRDALVSLVPSRLDETRVVPGSLLSLLSALAAPETFLWSRLLDAGLSLADRRALEIHGRVERWALDEAPLPGRLVHHILQWLYREDRLCRGTLAVRGRTVGPADLRLPTLAVVNTADEIAPPASVTPFLEAMPVKDARLIEYPGEVGVGLQHLAILAGRRAYACIWPQIIAWLQAHRRTLDRRPCVS